MIESISHITFIVKDVQRSAELFRFVFNAEEVYDSNNKNYSAGYEKFFLIAGTWIAIMEGDSSLDRSYNHIAFKISESDFDEYIERVKASGLEILEGRNRIEGEARSVYFYDYDNHLFELHTGTLAERLSCYRKKALR
jgi:catechol 2,3-dioxygenase-like lactoylglutathione lyase family enzyme